MSALTAPRATIQWSTKAVLDMLEIPLQANAVIFNGAIVVLSAGFGKSGVTGTGLIACGVAQLVPELASITAGSSNGATTIRVAQGVFKFNNSSAGDLIAQTEVGTQCFIVDDNTVAKTNGGATRSAAGFVMAVDSSGVFVAIGLQRFV